MLYIQVCFDINSLNTQAFVSNYVANYLLGQTGYECKYTFRGDQHTVMDL